MELSFHQKMTQAELEAGGLGPGDARRRMHREVGNTTAAREAARAIWVPAAIDDLRTDLRYAVRTLRRQPIFTLAAIATLVVAIGLNASVFTVFNAIFIRPWPVPQPERVFVASLMVRPGAPDGSGLSGLPYAEVLALRERTVGSDLLASHRAGLRLRPAGADEHPDRVAARIVSLDFFDVLRVPLQRGGGFHAQRADGGAEVAIISDALWQRAFAADPDIIGRLIYINDVPTIITGVLSPAFRGIAGDRSDLYVPFPAEAVWAERSGSWWGPAADADPDRLIVNVAGRLRPGWTRDRAQTELEVLRRQLAAGTSYRDRQIVLSGTALGQQLDGGIRRQVRMLFALLFGATLLVLILGCANVANLQLARGLARSQEVATRLAIGAGRGRLVRQFLTESMLLASVAGAAALAVAWVLPGVVLSFDPTSESTSLRWTPDAVVLGFSLLLSVTTAVAFGLGPALLVTGRKGQPLLRLRGRGDTPSVGVTRSVLLAMQVAVSVALVAGATLIARDLVHAVSTRAGHASDLIAGVVRLPEPPSRDVQQALFTASLREALRTGLPGAALTERPPFDRGFTSAPASPVRVESAGPPKQARIRAVSPEYFGVLGIGLIAGRAFRDDPAAAEVVVNEALVRAFAPADVRVGMHVTLGDSMHTIAGIAEDVYLDDLQTISPSLFRPIRSSALLTVLVPADVPDARSRLSSIVRRLDPGATVEIKPLDVYVSSVIRNSVAGAWVASGLGVLTLGLAVVGVFGMFGFLVEGRRREIGIRLALGARPPHIVKLIFGTTGRALAAGLTAGLLLAYAGGRLLRGFLYGLGPLDPPTYLIVAAILTGAAAMAAFGPVRRALRVDPATTLRVE